MSAVEITLTQGYVALVDEADADLVLAHKWCALRQGNLVYAQRGVRKPDGRWTCRSMHAFLTGFAMTDHRNGDGLDNRRSNLREATKTQNNRNGRRRNGISGFKGVTLTNPRTGLWKARIGVDMRTVCIGYFATAEDAARAYDAAARELHGEFATFNFPMPGERAS